MPIGADFLSGVRTFVKDKVDVARSPTNRGTGAWTRRGLPILTASSLAASGHLDDSGGQSEGVEVRIQGLGRMPAIQTGPQSLQDDHTAGASSSGSDALVPAGAMPIAYASDGGGAIRVSRPAANLSDETNWRDRYVEFDICAGRRDRFCDFPGASVPVVTFPWLTGRCAGKPFDFCSRP